MKDFVNVGLLGAGTVGGGVLRVLEDNAEEIEKKVGLPIRITKVLDRNVDVRNMVINISLLIMPMNCSKIRK